MEGKILLMPLSISLLKSLIFAETAVFNSAIKKDLRSLGNCGGLINDCYCRAKMRRISASSSSINSPLKSNVT